VADRVLDALRTPLQVNGREVSVGASLGIAFAEELPTAERGARGARRGEAGDGAAAADALLRNADLALYAAKGQGRFRHATYAPSMHAHALARLELEGELRVAVTALGAGDPAHGGFALAYQPIVDLDGEAGPGFEALLRWTPPGRPPVPPLQVVPVAEETGLIVPLGRWVLREACRQLAAWDAAGAAGGDGPLQVSVNVSGRQLQDPSLVADVEAALADAGVAPGRLVVEITESVMMHDAEATRARLMALKALGVRVAIDDFGTGYSSLAYLRQFPVDVLKIDKTFVDDVGRGGDESVLATAIVTLGRALALTTVAEGIEDAAQLARLRALGCARGQGHLFARPLAAADVPGWLDGWLARGGAPAEPARA
jgi:EAL domain-containing protein (putative c-di-GMP-specific phosphodiesterase class I)